MMTRVIFADGTEIYREWPNDGSAGQSLTMAIEAAETAHGTPHNGAWLEFVPAANPVKEEK